MSQKNRTDNQILNDITKKDINDLNLRIDRNQTTLIIYGLLFAIIFLILFLREYRSKINFCQNKLADRSASTPKIYYTDPQPCKSSVYETPKNFNDSNKNVYVQMNPVVENRNEVRAGYYERPKLSFYQVENN